MNLPIDFVSRTKALLGDEEFLKLEEALNSNSPVSIRINTPKYNSKQNGQNVPWSENGLYLESRPQFTFDPLLHAGCYYVQEASSMFVERALRTYVTKPSIMLDLCAAPGGKSTLARAVLPEGSLLVSNEIMRNRSQILAENLIKWGNPNVIVTNNDSEDYSSLTEMFDVILTDVPCSGEGMFRKDDVAIQEWSVSNVNICYTRQREILTNIWKALKPGGILIYSTCTYNREENEDNVDWISNELGAEVLPVSTKNSWNITGDLTGRNLPVYRFMPHKTIGEGFFMAVLRKNGGEDYEDSVMNVDNSRKSIKAGKNKNKGKDGSKGSMLTITQEMKDCLLNSEDFNFEVIGEKVYAFPLNFISQYEKIKSSLKVIHAGVEIGMQKGKNFIPGHSLAMSTALNREKFTCVELDYKSAIAYLRTEAVAIDDSYPKGYVLFTYKDVPLGFAKNIGNRTNNLYPQEWKIRSGYVPDIPVEVLK